MTEDSANTQDSADAQDSGNVEGSANTVINSPASEVFDVVTDVTRMGDWSPECVGVSWVEPATGPVLGAKFEGDNVAKVGPFTVKKWTTTSEVTEYTPNEVFEFVTEGITTWRYEFEPNGDATRVTESYSHKPYTGWHNFLYNTLGQRSKGMVAGMQKTLDSIKTSIEA